MLVHTATIFSGDPVNDAPFFQIFNFTPLQNFNQTWFKKENLEKHSVKLVTFYRSLGELYPKYLLYPKYPKYLKDGAKLSLNF